VEVSKAKASNADFVLLVCRLNDAILLRREMVKQRWNPMGIVSPGLARDVRGAVLQGARQALGALDLQRALVQPERQAHQDRRESLLKQNPKDKLVFHGLNAGFTFEALLIAADAFKRAKTTDPKALADAIRQTNIADKMTLGGPIKFNEKGQVEGIGSPACRTATSCRPSCSRPDAATAKPIFPVPDYKKT
jgi:branched-chain amino acid transport system substrate-binding protein